MAAFQHRRTNVRRSPFQQGATAICSTATLSIFLCVGWCATPEQKDAPQPKRPLSALIADLKKGEADQLKALQELESLADRAADAVPAMVPLLTSKSEDVRLQTAITLGKIGKA